jgi:hypothetical protein
MSYTYSNHSSSTHSLSLKLQVVCLMTFFDVKSLLWFIQNIYFYVYSKSSNKKEFKQWCNNTDAKNFILCLGIYIYRVSQEECARLREGVPYVKVHWYNPKHLCPKLNSYRDNGQRKVWSSGGSTQCTCQLTSLIDVRP